VARAVYLIRIKNGKRQPPEIKKSLCFSYRRTQIKGEKRKIFQCKTISAPKTSFLSVFSSFFKKPTFFRRYALE
jgi:hypothetical protein